MFFWVAVAVGTIVVGLILWSIVRYRARGNVDELPRQTSVNIPIEILYTAIPLVIAAALFGLSVKAQAREDRLTARPDVRVEVVGFQWQWQFRYVDEGVTITGDLQNPPTLVLPAGRTTQLKLVTGDVIHSFFVPDFLVKRDVIPGVDNRLDLHPTRVGVFKGRCAEFCGLAHDRMLFDVETKSPADYRSWVASQGGKPA